MTRHRRINYPSHRKSPIQHTVHPRDPRYSVNNYTRGQGRAPGVNRKVRKSRTLRSKRLTTLSTSANSRRNWIVEMWSWLHSGRVDFNINAHDKLRSIHRNEYLAWEDRDDRNIMDLQDRYGLDMKRPDVQKFKNPWGVNVYVGSNNNLKRTSLALFTMKVLRTGFTQYENKAMGSVFLEADRWSKDALGTCSGYPSFRGNYITIRGDMLEDDLTVTHELIHGMRWGLGEHHLDRDREEIETELETICRLPIDYIKQAEIPGGYYYEVPDIKNLSPSMRDAEVRYAMLNDREIVMGKEDRIMKGRPLRRRINKFYNKTLISRAKFSPGERVDRYFQVKDQGIKWETHVRYEKPPTLAKIKIGFIREHGKDVEVWEYRDGKKVKIL